MSFVKPVRVTAMSTVVYLRRGNGPASAHDRPSRREIEYPGVRQHTGARLQTEASAAPSRESDVLMMRRLPHAAEIHSGLRKDQPEEQEFRRLAEKWRDETGMYSSVAQKINHAAYRQIIALGKPAVPLILRELRDRPGFWFEALRTITGQTPVTARERSDLKKVRQAWLNWGKEQGLIE